MRWSARMVLVSVMLVLTVGSAAYAFGVGKSIFFTENEAKDLRLSEEEWQEAGRATKALRLNNGPRIIFEAPVVRITEEGPIISTGPVINFFVHFEENSAPVNMETLEVKARKGWFSKSLTDRLKPYVKGAKLTARKLKIPTGKFVLEIAIADVQGQETVESYRVVVED